MRSLQLRVSVFFFAIILLTTTGCFSKNTIGSSQETTGKPKIERLDSKTGLLKSLGIDLGEKGSHLIEEENGQITLLYSDYIDLNNEKYINKKVTVNGKITIGTEGQKNILKVENITGEESPLSGENQTSEPPTTETVTPTENTAIEGALNDGTLIEGTPSEKTTGTTTSTNEKNIQNSGQVAEVQTGKMTEEQKKVSEYLKNNLQTFIPQTTENNPWTITKYEFAESNYMYIVLANKDTSRRELLSYRLTGESVEITILASFKTGETKDWEIESGNDIAAGLARVVYNENEEGAEKTISVIKGYRYFENPRLHFIIQFPSNWYYEGAGNFYRFSNQPVTQENALVDMEIITTDNDINSFRGTKKTVGDYTIVLIEDAEKITAYATKNGKKTFKFTSTKEHASTIEIMAGSIQETD